MIFHDHSCGFGHFDFSASVSASAFFFAVFFRVVLASAFSFFAAAFPPGVLLFRHFMLFSLPAYPSGVSVRPDRSKILSSVLPSAPVAV